MSFKCRTTWHPKSATNKLPQVHGCGSFFVQPHPASLPGLRHTSALAAPAHSAQRTDAALRSTSPAATLPHSTSISSTSDLPDHPDSLQSLLLSRGHGVLLPDVNLDDILGELSQPQHAKKLPSQKTAASPAPAASAFKTPLKSAGRPWATRRPAAPTSTPSTNTTAPPAAHKAQLPRRLTVPPTQSPSEPQPAPAQAHGATLPPLTTSTPTSEPASSVATALTPAHVALPAVNPMEQQQPTLQSSSRSQHMQPPPGEPLPAAFARPLEQLELTAELKSNVESLQSPLVTVTRTAIVTAGEVVKSSKKRRAERIAAQPPPQQLTEAAHAASDSASGSDVPPGLHDMLPQALEAGLAAAAERLADLYAESAVADMPAQLDLLSQEPQTAASKRWRSPQFKPMVLPHIDVSPRKVTRPPPDFVNTDNWRWHAAATFPKLYDAGWHDSFYEFMFEFWPAVGKAHGKGQQQRPFLTSAYAFARLCFQSQDFHLAATVVMSFLESVGDYDGLLADSAEQLPEEMVKKVLVPLIRVFRPEEAKEFVSAVQDVYPDFVPSTVVTKRWRRLVEKLLRLRAVYPCVDLTVLMYIEDQHS